MREERAVRAPVFNCWAAHPRATRATVCSGQKVKNLRLSRRNAGTSEKASNKWALKTAHRC
ncbi:hypothetical protein F383_19866 [Gossypium arboreum]|uniref:Uncharacterized protein n=1 Tax=Gossypium arboreum TaxID=29729 RepID=A0A0B0NJ48_GOSAR|nr:hypothetical protein F383_19866 [Gossypium arboreum]